MNLTTAQRTSLTSDINAQAALATARTLHDAPAVANFYNALTSPTVAVWKTSVPKSALDAVANWTFFGGLAAIKQNIYFALTDPVNPSAANIRTAFAQVWTVAGDQTPLLNLAQRTATRLEALFGAGGPPIVCQVDATGASLFGQSLDAQTVSSLMGW